MGAAIAYTRYHKTRQPKADTNHLDRQRSTPYQSAALNEYRRSPARPLRDRDITMKKMLFALLLSSAAAHAAPSTATQAEINHLFSYLEQSGCQFNRNGTWYTSVEASAHLHDKYNYLLKRDLVSSTENFIDRAASESSMTGKAYLVRCQSPQAQQSGAWFRAELQRYRQQGK